MSNFVTWNLFQQTRINKNFEKFIENLDNNEILDCVQNIQSFY